MEGNNEIQPFEGEECELHIFNELCQKNPKHETFIPIKDFKIEHLPEGYREPVLYDFIIATADLVVRLIVKKNSPKRPEFWPGTNTPYPFNYTKDKCESKTGSGEIHGVRRLDVEEGEHSYKKENKCFDSDKRNSVWEVSILTATHVVFDEFEAIHASCRLFFDSNDSPKLILDKLSINELDIKKDKCILKCITCDHIGEKLYQMLEKKHDLLRRVMGLYRDSSDLIFIVSHPHGIYKQVSFGQLIDNETKKAFCDELDLTILRYTTGTCPGSSGAKVYCVGSSNGHVHSGCVLSSGLNYSCISYFFKM